MPDLPFYLLQFLLLPDVLCYIFEILSSPFLRLALAHPTDSHNVASVPTPTPDLTGHLPAGGVPDNSAIPLAQAPPVARGDSAFAQRPQQHSAVTGPPTNTLLMINLNQYQREDLPAVPQHSRAATPPSQQVLLSQALTVTFPFWVAIQDESADTFIATSAQLLSTIQRPE
jgi:hypothetical protein